MNIINATSAEAAGGGGGGSLCLEGGGALMPPPVPAKTSHKRDDRRLRQLIFRIKFLESPLKILNPLPM